MNEKDMVVYTDEALKNINNTLNNLLINPYLTCSYESNNEIKQEVIILDYGATAILKAYFKFKQSK